MKARMSLRQAQAIAQAIADMYAPACERIEIAGSIRRKAETVGDVELVAIPKPVLNLFGEPTGQTELDIMLEEQGAQLTKNGPKYKQMSALVKGDELQVDLFLADADNWGYILMLRTGPWQFSKRMVTPQMHNGLKPSTVTVANGYVNQIITDYEANTRDIQRVPVPDEETLFQLWGMDYIKPEDRK